MPYDIIDSSFVEHFYGAFGISDWLEASISLPVLWDDRQINPDDPLSGAMSFRDLGDLQLELKARILDNRKYPLGLAIAPFITVPTGNKEHFAGNEGATGGGKIVLDGIINDRYMLALNTGFIGRKKFDAYGLELGNQFLLGAGASAKIVRGLFITGEVDSSTTFSDFYSNKDKTSVELRGGLKWNIAKTGITLGASGGGGLIYGVGTPKYRVIGTISYTYPAKSKNQAKWNMQEVRDAKTILPEEKIAVEVSALAKTGETEDNQPSAAPKMELKTAVYFSLNSYLLSEESKNELNRIISILNKIPTLRVKINGYCDDSGPLHYNIILSEQRAEVVFKYLNRKGISEDTMSFNGKGVIETVYPTAISRQLSRKTEIILAD